MAMGGQVRTGEPPGRIIGTMQDARGEPVAGALVHVASSLGDTCSATTGADEAMPFNKRAIRSIISNVLVYAGWVRQGRGKDMQINDEAHTMRELILLSDAVQGQHPPLIDEQLVDQVLAARHKRLDFACPAS